MNGSDRPVSSGPQDRSPLTVGGDPQIVELRIALVLYGGVSLAVYIHGITKELEALLRASRAFEAALHQSGEGQPTADGLLPATGTERIYFDQLVQLWQAGVPMSATVDVIAGTSAGGINGICLAKAVVRNTTQDELTRLWMDKGDISHLLRYGFLGRHLGELATALAVPMRANHPGWSPLKGTDMCQWLYEALANMDAYPGEGTLLPPGGTLDLYVTTTDLRGTDQVLPLGVGGALHDHTYQRMFQFGYRPDGGPTGGTAEQVVPPDTIGKGFAGALAYAARATSSFPGAFPPINLAEFATAVNNKEHPHAFDPREFVRLFMPDYEDATAEEAMRVYEMDGGVLANAPFDPVVGAIAAKPAGRQVTRHLVFVEPDPGADSPAAIDPSRQCSSGDAQTPTWLGGVWAALSTIPHHQPLLAAMRGLAHINDEVTTISQVVASLQDDVLSYLRDRQIDPQRAPELSFTELAAWSDRIHASVPEVCGTLNYRVYGRVKMEAVADRLARDLADHLGYPAGSSRASFLHTAFIAWVHSRAEWTTRDDALVRDWLRPLDVPYRERRLELILAGINDLFTAATAEQAARGATRRDKSSGTAHPAPSPSRHQLAEAKQAAWTLLLAERAKPAEAIRLMPAEVTAFVSRHALGQVVLMTNPVRWAHDHEAEIAALVQAYHTEIAELTADSAQQLWQAFQQSTADWPRATPARAELATRYVAFPLWDALLFPVQSLSRLPLFNPIHVSRFSPRDATALKPPPDKSGKLAGVSVHHFGAFFELDRRQNDYLWGRLDGAELLLDLLREQYTAARGEGSAALPNRGHYLREAFDAVLATEQTQLGEVTDLVTKLRRQLEDMTDTS